MKVIRKSYHLPPNGPSCLLTPLNTDAPGVQPFTSLVTHEFNLVSYEFASTSPLTCISMPEKTKKRIMMNW